MHEGNEEQGKYGKQGWSIACRFIAVAMGESDKGKDPVDLYLDERVAHGRATLDQPAWQESQVQLKGGSIKIAYRDVGGRAPTVGAFRRRRSGLPGVARFSLTNSSGTNLNS